MATHHLTCRRKEYPSFRMILRFFPVKNWYLAGHIWSPKGTPHLLVFLGHPAAFAESLQVLRRDLLADGGSKSCEMLGSPAFRKLSFVFNLFGHLLLKNLQHYFDCLLLKVFESHLTYTPKLGTCSHHSGCGATLQHCCKGPSRLTQVGQPQSTTGHELWASGC